MKYYELTIVSKNLPEPEEIISSLEIKVEKQQRGSNFLTLEFYTEPERIAEIEKKLKSIPSARYMILTKKVPKVEVKIPRRPPRLPKTFQAKPEKRIEEKKVELKEIEKKLEEILKSDNL